MTYLFRLTASSKKPGVFDFEDARREFDLGDGTIATVVARNSEDLRSATSIHFDVPGFDTEDAARAAAEQFRLRLRIVNAVLGIGLTVPVGNSPSAQVADFIKDKLKAEQDAVVVDGVWGVSVFPDDGRHFECVVAGEVAVKPAEPGYIFSAMQTIWPLSVNFDPASETALEILGLASSESSEKATFLTSYLALEPLVQRKPRSKEEIALIKGMQRGIERAKRRKRKPLDHAKAESLLGGLKALHEESFSSSLMRFARSVEKPIHIRGRPTTKFFSECIRARNKLAHKADPNLNVPIAELSAGIREVVMAMIWTRNGLPSFTMNVPGSSVSIPAGGLSFRVL